MNAIRMANKLLTKLELSWEDVTSPQKGKPDPKSRTWHKETAQTIIDAAEPNDLTEREWVFVGDMLTWNTPTTAQIDWLNNIYRRVFP